MLGQHCGVIKCGRHRLLCILETLVMAYAMPVKRGLLKGRSRRHCGTAAARRQQLMSVVSAQHPPAAPSVCFCPPPSSGPTKT